MNNRFADRAPLHPSELDFDLALVDAAPAALQAHVAGCARCQARLTALRQEQQAFAASPEAARVARLTASRLEERTWSVRLRRWWFLPVTASAVAAACLAILFFPGKGGIQLKGGPAVEAFVKRGDSVPERWLPSTVLGEGDAVQLGYRAGGFARLTVFSLAGCDARLEYEGAAEPEGLIPAGWQVRHPTGGERLYVAFSQQPVSVEAFSAALRQTPAGCDPAAAPEVSGVSFVAKGIALSPGERP